MSNGLDPNAAVFSPSKGHLVPASSLPQWEQPPAGSSPRQCRQWTLLGQSFVDVMNHLARNAELQSEKEAEARAIKDNNKGPEVFNPELNGERSRQKQRIKKEHQERLARELDATNKEFDRRKDVAKAAWQKGMEEVKKLTEATDALAGEAEGLRLQLAIIEQRKESLRNGHASVFDSDPPSPEGAANAPPPAAEAGPPVADVANGPAPLPLIDGPPLVQDVAPQQGQGNADDGAPGVVMPPPGHGNASGGSQGIAAGEGQYQVVMVPIGGQGNGGAVVGASASGYSGFVPGGTYCPMPVDGPLKGQLIPDLSKVASLEHLQIFLIPRYGEPIESFAKLASRFNWSVDKTAVELKWLAHTGFDRSPLWKELYERAENDPYSAWHGKSHGGFCPTLRKRYDIHTSKDRCSKADMMLRFALYIGVETRCTTSGADGLGVDTSGDRVDSKRLAEGSTDEPSAKRRKTG